MTRRCWYHYGSTRKKLTKSTCFIVWEPSLSKVMQLFSYLSQYHSSKQTPNQPNHQPSEACMLYWTSTVYNNLACWDLRQASQFKACDFISNAFFVSLCVLVCETTKNTVVMSCICTKTWQSEPQVTFSRELDNEDARCKQIQLLLEGDTCYTFTEWLQQVCH